MNRLVLSAAALGGALALLGGCSKSQPAHETAPPAAGTTMNQTHTPPPMTGPGTMTHGGAMATSPEPMTTPEPQTMGSPEPGTGG